MAELKRAQQQCDDDDDDYDDDVMMMQTEVIVESLCNMQKSLRTLLSEEPEEREPETNTARQWHFWFFKKKYTQHNTNVGFVHGFWGDDGSETHSVAEYTPKTENKAH